MSVFPVFADLLIKEAEECYLRDGLFGDKILENLNSVFGELFTLAVELVDHSKIIKYQTSDVTRTVYKLISSKGQYTLFDKINFCYCNFFHLQVLDTQNKFTCKHVLSCKLAVIMNKFTTETLTDRQFADFLNEQMYYLTEN